MAKVEFDMGIFGEQLEQLGSRENLRRILQAGSAAAVEDLKKSTAEHRHVVTGEMMAAIGPGPVHEDLGRAWQYVYPGGGSGQDKDLAVIAYVINYGYGGKRTKKTGDRFLTGHQDTLDEAVGRAMEAEAERIKNDIMR